MRRAIVFAALAAACTARVVAQSALSGSWTIDRARSENPREIGFGASFMPELPAPEPGAQQQRGGRRNGGGGGGRTNPAATRPDSADDARRIQLLTDAVRTPPVNLTIADEGSTVTITVDGLSRTFHPNVKEESIALDQVSVPTITTRVGGNLVIDYEVAQGREIRYTYYRASNEDRLIVDAAFVERGAVDSVRRVYIPGTATGGLAPSSDAPASPTALPAPALLPPGGEFRGLTKLGVLVEELSKQAAGCGLTKDAIEAAVRKSVAGHGLEVVDDVTPESSSYLYVNVMTTATASGLCVSRFDVSLLTHAAASLPYQQQQRALVEVQLAHSGSLAGGDAKTHADQVMQGITQDADEIAQRIQNAR
jgi:hypothetical protein